MTRETLSAAFFTLNRTPSMQRCSLKLRSSAKRRIKYFHLTCGHFTEAHYMNSCLQMSLFKIINLHPFFTVFGLWTFSSFLPIIFRHLVGLEEKDLGTLRGETLN